MDTTEGNDLLWLKGYSSPQLEGTTEGVRGAWSHWVHSPEVERWMLVLILLPPFSHSFTLGFYSVVLPTFRMSLKSLAESASRFTETARCVSPRDCKPCQLNND